MTKDDITCAAHRLNVTVLRGVLVHDNALYKLTFYLLTYLHPNGSADGKVMTSYRFFQRATIELEIYPGFGFSDSAKIRSRDNFPTPLT